MWSRCHKLVRAQERPTVESNIKSEHNLYLACEDSQQCAFFFCTFSCSLLALLASTVHWLCCFLFLNATNHWLHSVLDSAKHVHCGGPAMLSYPFSIVKKRHSSLSSTTRLGMTSGILECQCTWRMSYLRAHEHKLTFLSVTDTYIRTYVHTYIRTYVRTLWE